MADRLTRRERAALRLALECARGRNPYGALASAVQALAFCRDTSLFRALATVERPGWYGKDASMLRLIRARLALCLRARLRADAGWDERAPWWCLRCGALRCTRLECEGAGEHSRILPLWDQAPAHGTWRHGCWRTGLVIDVPIGEPCDECGTRSPAREEDR